MLFKTVRLFEQPADSMSDDGIPILLRHAQPNPRGASLILCSEDQQRPVTCPLFEVVDSLEIERTTQPARARKLESLCGWFVVHFTLAVNDLDTRVENVGPDFLEQLPLDMSRGEKFFVHRSLLF